MPKPSQEGHFLGRACFCAEWGHRDGFCWLLQALVLRSSSVNKEKHVSSLFFSGFHGGSNHHDHVHVDSFAQNNGFHPLGPQSHSMYAIV